MTTVTPETAISAEDFLADPAGFLALCDVIVVNHSGGKDSSVALWRVYLWAKAAGVLDRVVVLHNDLGAVEWPSTGELDAVHAAHYRDVLGGTLTELLGDRPSARGIAEQQAAKYGLPFVVYTRNQGDLLQQIEQYGEFPTAKTRHCTSEQKRGPKFRAFTEMVRQLGDLGRKVRILDVNGMRAEESTARARKSEFDYNRVASNRSKRDVWTWMPIHHLTEQQVWQIHDDHGLEWHWAYDAGMSRLSCSLCVLGSVADVTLACLLRPDLAAEYAALEQRINHLFKAGRSITWYVENAKKMRRARAAAGEPVLQSRPRLFLDGAAPAAPKCAQLTLDVVPS
jgi:3'-phosphoadenosine 5'-phosphosulfate sulfotransferase (PAPS reductase)/FAD synthetase